jgi:DedD protein
MDRSLKERLVGAAVLVAIGAWLIPWVLDGPEQSTISGTTALELPIPASNNPPMRAETIVLEQQRDAPLPNAASDVQARPSVPVASSDESATAPSKPPVASAPSPSAVRPAANAEPASPRAAETTNATATSDPGATRWYVQLGAFQDRGNADRLAARVQTYGFDANVLSLPASGGTVHRVRVGPQPTRERSEAIASSLSAHGFLAQIMFE